jgi:glyoxylase-like metal-dependent hydrolase (beta-lactamase superfamily II)
MEKTAVTALDLNFRNHKQTIASYFVRHSTGAVLVESGPSTTLPALQSELAKHGLTPKDVTHVLLTHIHLDHAGASGWWARQGAEILVHPVGAPHLLDPERLLASAKRIYGDEMESLWGEVLPVPEDKLRIVEDGEEVAIGGLRFLPLSTPGHAEHHHAYLFEDLCFSGDIGGIRLPGYQYLRLPMPPPELFLERWEESVAKLRKAAFARIAPTHFGIYEDASWHLDQLEKELIETNRWVQNCMTTEPDESEFLKAYSEWMHADGETKGIPEEIMDTYDVTNPPHMSAMGLRRYWMKVRKAR